MIGSEARNKKQLQLATELIDYLRPRMNTPVSIRLWDGSLVPMGENVEPGLEFYFGTRRYWDVFKETDG